MDEIIVLFLAMIMLVNIAALFPGKETPDPKEQRIRDWKRNKKKWAKHKFDV